MIRLHAPLFFALLLVLAPVCGCNAAGSQPLSSDLPTATGNAGAPGNNDGTTPSSTGSSTPTAAPAPANTPIPTDTPAPHAPTSSTATHHIFVIAEENTSYSNVIGNTSQMPYLNSLVPKATIWGNYYSNAHGSMLSYIETISGQTFNCTGNDCAKSGALTGPSLMDVMNSNGMTWKGYFDGLKDCGQLAPQSSNWIIDPDSNGKRYFQMHTPFPWYAVGTATIANCSNNNNGWWPVTQLTTDLASRSVGQFNWISPDGTNDGHDSGPPQQDAFMQQYLTPLLASSYFQPGGDGILIIW